jgi:NAD-dependent deacetylase
MNPGVPRTESLAALADLMGSARRILVFTGAGISTESGIPDFRGPNGVWKKYDPNEFTIQNFLRDAESRRRYWRRSTEMYRTIRASRPNPAHLAVARLEAAGRLGAVVTQNVDGLHQEAGNSPGRVIELHGTTREIGCLKCGRRVPREEFQPRVREDGSAPDCAHCGGLMKPATISFGQALSPETLERAEAETERCDLFLVIGSSLQVYPAAGYPLLAHARGTPLAILNLQETPHDAYARAVVRRPAGEVLPPIVDALAPPKPLPH